MAVSQRLSLAVGISAALSLGTVSAQVSPGWYADVGIFTSQVEDAEGTTTPTVITLTPSTLTPGQACLLGPVTGSIPVLGGALEGLGDLLSGGTGCLLGLLGSGADPTLEPGEQVETTGAAQPLALRFDSGFGIQTAIGYQFEGGLRPELALSFSQNDFTASTPSAELADARNNVSGKLEAFTIGANLWFDISASERIRPYLGAGFGYQQNETTFDTTGSDEHGTRYFQGGAGVGFVLNPRTVLSLDYRYRVSGDIESEGFIAATTPPDPDAGGVVGVRLADRYEHEAQQIGLSVRYVFSEGEMADADGDGVSNLVDRCPNTPSGVQVDRYGCPLDSDGDGVPDHLDACPNTPAGATVDTRGCPADADGDGVADYLDQCPGTPQGMPVNAQGCPIDSDGDGVPDALDKCPGTPAGVEVDAEGCPAKDSDGDGIPDFRDLCPGTPDGITVGPDGCPLDRDGDGIPDHLDECPESPAGAVVLPNGCALVGDCRRPRPGEEVDARGCAVDRSFILKGVKFEFDSAVLTEAAKRILDQVSETLIAYPEINVELEGHTDNVGTAAYNLGLSERRSITVKTYLASKGVAPDRMVPVGYGLSQPIADNNTEEGREENRRVELTVRD